MLTYLPPESRPMAPTHEKPWILLLLAFAWLWPGVFSHGLWKPDEPAVNAAVLSLLEGGNPWLPSVLGQPYGGVPPVYIWVAAACRYLFSPWLADAYSAMRFASVLFTVIGLTASGMAGFHLLGRHQGRSVVLILIGCAGLIMAGHFLGGMSVQFAALGLCWYGLSLARQRVIVASAALGGGWLLLSLSAGWLVTAAAVAVSLLLALCTPWRQRRYKLSLCGALAVCLPLMLIYPLALYQSSPAGFAWWWQSQMFGTFGGTATFSLAFSLFYYLKNLLWFAFPAWLLALWTLSRSRLCDSDWGCLTAVWLAVFGVLLAVEPETYQDNLIWLMPPLAVLGAAKLDSLRRGVAAFLNWFGIMLFGLLALFLWVGFVAMNFGWPARLAARAAYFSPYYVSDIDVMPMVVAVLFTPLWLWAITRKHIKGRQAVTNWAAGMTLVWALLMTLFLPWLDAAKSFKPVVEQMEAAVPEDLRNGSQCLYITHSSSALLAWSEYGSLPFMVNTDNRCRYRLVQVSTAQQDAPGWQTVWQGGRPRSKQERFRLLQRLENE